MAGVTVLPCLGVLLVILSRILPIRCGEPLMPAMFILGDSLVDVGNNNYIITLAKSNFAPNGLDFPQGATGRFCNGRTTSDFLVQMMGLPFPPAYLSPNAKGPIILKGLNYASAAGGILDSTGYNYIGRIGLNKQLEYLTKTRQDFVGLVGEGKTAEIFAKAFWYVTIGSNDYINNYLLANSATSKQFTPKQYEGVLISTFNQQLRRLYSLGARKIFIFGVGPLGCIPSQLYNQKSPDGSCIEFINSYVRGFNQATKSLLKDLTNSLPGSIYVYGNAYDLVDGYVHRPAEYGFTVVNKGCCGLGPYNGAIPCLPTVKPCPDRAAYLFWDPFHPTDKGNGLLANSFFSGGPEAIEPVNVRTLASMP
ncbi:hypothetical protein KC19_2G102000 [Ceratodon purpureus]|uniref:Uncharacterized protein n=1 Tax=Ceratodon purpureus TaxID=3225 RepID=A0A8T0IV79_CERPU|nr:hypothetical protein KC19_2G102000 [Ceratodon purpureus]